ncbi:MAG: MBL fold metallo-hydrolase [bacterium]
MTVYKSDSILVERYEVGMFLVNTYIVGCLKTQQGAIIDPAAEGDQLLERCRELNLTLQYIINTHGHADHIAENSFIKQKTNAPIAIHAKDAPMLTDARRNLSAFFGMPLTSPPADVLIVEGEPFSIGEINFEILHTPGHSPGSICLIHDPIALVGDVLFFDSIGRTDFPEGSFELLVDNIRTKLLPLGDHFQAFPGHGPDTTLGRERRENPFLNYGL